MEAQHKTRHQGKRWQIIYGVYEGPEAAALNEVNAALQYFLPFTVKTNKASALQTSGNPDHTVLIGTRKNNRLIDKIAKKGLIKLPGKPEGYTIKVMPDPAARDKKLVVIAGEDANGVLYGALDFSNKFLMKTCLPGDRSKLRERLDAIKPMEMTDYPRITNRGIWSWGYVIYDYRRFFDNMARMKMNMAVIWNDEPPVNSKAIIAYAHSKGIKVVYGFPWGWGFKVQLNLPSDRNTLKKLVIKEFKAKYAKLGLDGIYFQTVTETHDQLLAGKTIASWATMLVNEISREIFKINPKLYLQFGLHASSIMKNYTDLKKLDPRVVIMWEDAGMLPFAYHPVTTAKEFTAWSGGSKPVAMVDNPAKTMQYAKKIALVRGKKEFAMVPKGWTCLDWTNEFEHHGNFILGERRREYIRDRLIRRQPRWDKVNAMWYRKAGVASTFYREIIKLGLPVITVTGLIEDGLFEEKIQPSVRIFAATLWNPARNNRVLFAAANASKDKTC